MSAIQELLQLLEDSAIDTADWPALIGLMYVTVGMNLLASAAKSGGNRSEQHRAALLAILDESRSVIADWTPEVEIKAQLEARFSGKRTGM